MLAEWDSQLTGGIGLTVVVLPARLLASSRPGTPLQVKGGWRPLRSNASGSEHP
jgi:hypothetical protein